jgi:hypothetical protein
MERQRSPCAVEKDQVEVEAHAEGVDAGAAGDQQAATNLGAAQPCQAQQPATEAGRDRDIAPKHEAAGQVAQAGGGHIRPSSGRRRSLPRADDLPAQEPLPGANGRSAPVPNRHRRTMIGKIMDLFRRACGQTGFNSNG